MNVEGFHGFDRAVALSVYQQGGAHLRHFLAGFFDLVRIKADYCYAVQHALLTGKLAYKTGAFYLFAFYFYYQH